MDTLDRVDMEHLAAGQEAALDALMDRHAPRLFHFLYRMVRDEDDANDLAQESFVRVYRSRDRYRPDQSFSTWLYTIAANLARNHLRWHSRHPAISLDAGGQSGESTLGEMLPAPGAGPGEEALAAERATAVRAAVDRLPPELREAIILCEWEECSVKAAAAICRTTPKAVESRLYRARQLLRESLSDYL